jgi:hypothetical protein
MSMRAGGAIGVVAVLLVGALTGAVVQKNYGFGNLLRSAGIPYPEAVRRPAAEPSRPPVIEIPENHRGRLLLFLLGGQSNMAGAAPVPAVQQEQHGVYVFGNDYHWRVAREPVDDPYGQVDQVSADRSGKLGPALAFAEASVSGRPDIAIGLIPCAKYSSGILDWQRNLSDRSLYGSCLKRARAASPMGRVAAVLFFQGETDALDPVASARFRPQPQEWSRLFSTFVTDIRSDLHEPDLPVVFAQIGRNAAPESAPYWEVVKDQQRSVTLPGTAMITTDDLPLLDGLHFTADAYRTIGNRFAKAYWGLRHPQ